MRVTVPVLGTALDLPPAPRLVSLVSSATEALFAIGAGAQVVGVTPSCARYVPGLAAPVVADDMDADPEAVRAVRPDLILATDGVQLPLTLILSGSDERRPAGRGPTAGPPAERPSRPAAP